MSQNYPKTVTDGEKEREIEKHGSRDVPIHVQLVTTQSNNEKNIQIKTETNTDQVTYIYTYNEW